MKTAARIARGFAERALLAWVVFGWVVVIPLYFYLRSPLA